MLHMPSVFSPPELQDKSEGRLLDIYTHLCYIIAEYGGTEKTLLSTNIINPKMCFFLNTVKKSPSWLNQLSLFFPLPCIPITFNEQFILLDYDITSLSWNPWKSQSFRLLYNFRFFR